MERRRAEVFSPFCHLWDDIKFGDIRRGMVFRLFEPMDAKDKEIANQPVKDNGGHTVFIAISNAYIDMSKGAKCTNDCHTIKADPIENWHWGDDGNSGT